MEEKNIADFIKNGPVPNAINSDPYQNSSSDLNLMKNSGIRYFAQQRQIVFQRPVEGVFLMVDLKGRVLYSIKLSKQSSANSMSVSLPATLSTGMYVAKLEGCGEKYQQMISVVK
jgi:hypothetical protein